MGARVRLRIEPARTGRPKGAALELVALANRDDLMHLRSSERPQYW